MADGPTQSATERLKATLSFTDRDPVSGVVTYKEISDGARLHAREIPHGPTDCFGDEELLAILMHVTQVKNPRNIGFPLPPTLMPDRSAD